MQAHAAVLAASHGAALAAAVADLTLIPPQSLRSPRESAYAERDLVRRPAIVPNPHEREQDVSGGGAAICSTSPSFIGNPTDARLFDTPASLPRARPLPASVGHGNLMLATWVLGVGCDGDELGNRLAKLHHSIASFLCCQPQSLDIDLCVHVLA